jgi:hypothetical protein
MARLAGHPCYEFSDEHSTNTLSWDLMERVTRIELALSAWESDRSPPLRPMTSQDRAPPVPVTDPGLPGLIAR